jgi:hypothetical protein
MSAVDTMLTAQGAAVYYTDAFRNVLEDHMTYLRKATSTTVMNVDPIKAYRFELDLDGLLLDMGIPLYLHWVVMRMNNLSSPQQVPADLTTLLICAPSELEMIRQSEYTKARLN